MLKKDREQEVSIIYVMIFYMQDIFFWEAFLELKQYVPSIS